jgi:hypothetical protein
MEFSLSKSIEILERTPEVLFQLLQNLHSDWTYGNEGADTWSAYDVIGHLIHGDKTDWINRAEMILSGKSERRFESFDRFAQFEESKGKSLSQLLNEFKTIRASNIERLRKLRITDGDLKKTGIHPSFGEVTLTQLLATWVVHDLDHISQISRVMAKQYKEEVGPWIAYLKILRH